MLGRRHSLFAGWSSPIQLSHDTGFDSIWEYQKRFESIDWSNILENLPNGRCPVCRKKGCGLRRITSYRRRVIELIPRYREGVIFVPRFQCGSKKTTFSLLPMQLAPYMRYTVASIFFALLVAERAARQRGMGLFSVAEKEIDENSRVNGCMLAFWLTMVVDSLRRNHSELRNHFELYDILPGRDSKGLLAEVAAYCQALGIRGPPQVDRLDAMIKIHVRTTERFLIGVASQHRHRRSVS